MYKRQLGATPASKKHDIAIVFQSSPSANTGCDTPPLTGQSDTKSFQSSPSANTGCDLRAIATTSWEVRFNPHPARTLGATAKPWTTTGGESGFNPHPARTLGATCPVARPERHYCRFQSSPSANTGCDVYTARHVVPFLVSILTQREHWVRPCR